MNTAMILQITSTGSDDTRRLGELLANNLTGGEVIELASDLGGGKTTFTQGLVHGLGSRDHASSPTFTLSKIYKCRDGLQIHHFDFYRLSEAGIMRAQMHESIHDPKVITVVEWAGIVHDVLPAGRLSIKFEHTPKNPDERIITIKYPNNFADIIRAIQTKWEEVRP